MNASSPSRSPRRAMAAVGAAAAAALLALPAAAAAQACAGWMTQPGQYAIGAGITSYDDATEYRAEVRSNLPGSLASEVFLGAVDIDDFDDNAFVVGGRVYWEMPQQAYWLCPTSGLRYERLSSDFEGVAESLSSLLVPVGMGIGTMLPAGDRAILLPFAQAGAMVGRTSVSVDGPVNGGPVEFSGSDTDVGYFLQLGAGVDLGRIGFRGAWERIDVVEGQNNLQLSVAINFY